MRSANLLGLLHAGTLDAPLAALLWLLVEGGVPLVVGGSADAATRGAVARAVLSADPRRDWVVLDVDEEPVGTERLAAMLRGGVAFALTTAAADLEAVFARLTTAGLPEDGVRRLGVVLLVEETGEGLRCPVVHYLRPAERDAQGHVQRRPPAVLAAWDEALDVYEHYAWAITPELADRVDRAQADLEERQAERASFLDACAAEPIGADEAAARVERYLSSEAPRTPAPEHQRARPGASPSSSTDPHTH